MPSHEGVDCLSQPFTHGVEAERKKQPKRQRARGDQVHQARAEAAHAAMLSALGYLA